MRIAASFDRGRPLAANAAPQQITLENRRFTLQLALALVVVFCAGLLVGRYGLR